MSVAAGQHHAPPEEMAWNINTDEDLACVPHLAAEVNNRLGAGAHDAIGPRPEVADDNDCAAPQQYHF